MDEEQEADDADGTTPAQDSHTMLAVALESFVELQRAGVVWDIVHNGRMHKNIDFVILFPL